MKAVTTFAPHHFDEYAHRMLESFVRFWPCELVAYVDYVPPFKHDKIEYRMLDTLYDLREFKEYALKQQKTCPQNYLYDAARFAHKAYAQIDMLERYPKEEIFWLDADVVTLIEISSWFMKGLLKDYTLCFLGRDTYTETGFIGFNPSGPYFPMFLNHYRDQYHGRKLFKLPYWTDCHAFDEARKGLAHVNDIGQGHGLEHVWCRSVLAPYMDHLKGKRKELGFSPEHPIKPYGATERVA